MSTSSLPRTLAARTALAASLRLEAMRSCRLATQRRHLAEAHRYKASHLRTKHITWQKHIPCGERRKAEAHHRKCTQLPPHGSLLRLLRLCMWRWYQPPTVCSHGGQSRSIQLCPVGLQRGPLKRLAVLHVSHCGIFSREGPGGAAPLRPSTRCWKLGTKNRWHNPNLLLLLLLTQRGTRHTSGVDLHRYT